MEKPNIKTLAYVMITFMVLYTFLPYITPVQIVSASGTRLPASSYSSSSTITTDLKIPKSMSEVEGTNDELLNYTKNIYPTSKKGQYYGANLPFDLVDTATGKVHPGYCAQSYIYASTNMSAQGVITDPRIYELIKVITPTNPESPSDAQQIAIQIALWGALNNNWSPDLFTKHISLDVKDYGRMLSVPDHLQRVAANWGNIINPKVKTMSPIKVKSTTIKAVCSEDKTNAVAEVEWAFMGGGTMPKLSDVADITYQGAEDAQVLHGGDPGVFTQMQEYGLKSKGNADYLVFTGTFEPPVTKEITAKIKYKGAYEVLNSIALGLYGGGSSYQPFILPKTTPLETKFKIILDCKPNDIPEEIEPTSNSTELRWYNMPMAFGEIKNGIGYNESGVTTKGKYAQTRSLETFEAMNGMPGTERLYVNLGGTEGFIDVTYTYEEVEQPFTVDWKTPWSYTYSCGDSTCTASGVESFDKTFNWKFKALHLKDATFRVFGDGAVRQDGLEYDLKIINTQKETGSHTLQPNANGLEVGPNTGVDKYNIGATNSWAPAQGTFTTAAVSGRVAVESDGKQEAYDKGNGNVGEVFAQNDKLEITIKGDTYTFVPDVNKKSEVPYSDGASLELDATNGEKFQYFNPVKEKWDVWSHVPIQGYNGNPEDDGQRSVDGTPILLEDLPINILKGNGIYEFETTEAGNVLDYETAVTTVKGSTHDLHKEVTELKDGTATGTGTVYESAKDPIDKEYYLDGNKLWLQYTNWQVPVESGKHGYQFKHSGKKPDGEADESLDDNPRYRSINPILIHDPTTTLYSWVSDIPTSQLQDQRINSSDERISKHSRATDEGANPRQYLDYDFQLTVPNVAAFETYWSQAAKNSQEEGFEDLDFTNPGTLGKGYKGNAVSQVTTRSYDSPYSGASGWDVSKWTTAKYVKFPYAVYYYKNTGESGGDDAGFYEAGAWIKLYDDNQTVKVGDPTTFNFHVSSEQKDIKDGIIYIASEAINSQDGLTGNGDALYRSGEQYINGTRNPEGTNVGSYNNPRDGEATYSTTNQINIDAVGRIGNLLVSDTSDPSWTGVFWKTQNGKVDVNTPVQKDYGSLFNIYESITAPNGTGFDAYNRFKTLEPWHGQSQPMHTIPLTTNVFTKGKEDQTVKLGYNVGGSIQTIGDYDYSMWIYPQNQLAGKFATGNPSQHFKLITSDPFSSGAKYQEYYDSEVNNTLHGEGGILGKAYQPKYQHLLSASLADPRMKMSDWEKKSTTYQKAVQLGSSKKILLGTPSWVVVPQSLRTLIGNDESQGRWGVSSLNGNNGLGAKDAAGSANCPCSYENAQKWNWNYGLPQNTQIWFDENPANINRAGIPKFEKPSKDQYIITSMTFRTKTDRNDFPGSGDLWQTEIVMPAIEYGDMYLVKDAQSVPDWDLTMYTNTGANGLPDLIKPTKNVPDGFTPSEDPSIPMTWDPTQEGDIGAPMLDIIWWNYAKPATTDKDNIGTH